MNIHFRLTVMNFMQFFVWGAWLISFGAYMSKSLGFTGIDDPYEAPDRAEIVVDTQRLTPDLAAGNIIKYLENHGYFTT